MPAVKTLDTPRSALWQGRSDDSPNTLLTRLTSTLSLNSLPVSLTASRRSSASSPVRASSLGM